MKCRFCEQEADHVVALGVCEERNGIDPKYNNDYLDNVVIPQALIQVGVCEGCLKGFKKKNLLNKFASVDRVMANVFLKRYHEKPMVEGADVVAPTPGVDIAFDAEVTNDPNYTIRHRIYTLKEILHPETEPAHMVNVIKAKEHLKLWYELLG